MSTNTTTRPVTRNLSFLITSFILAAISLTSSLILLMEKIELWKNPDYITSCSWNPVFSCQGPMNSWQSSVFIIPNPIIGIAGFSAVLMFLFLNMFVQAPKWLWVTYLAGVTGATIFIGWLISQTLYEINALCIYCMVVWACIIPLFWLTASHVITKFYPTTWLRFLPPLKWVLIAVSYATIILMIYMQFRSFFDRLLFGS